MIAELSGFRVFEVTPVDPATNLPDANNQAALWKHISAQSVENIAIYVDTKRTQSLWCWMKRDGKKLLPRRHVYIRDQPGDLFLSKLAALVIDLSELDEQGNLPITEAANRVRAALDVETVTKAFFKRFEEEHAVFLALIEGIEVASVERRDQLEPLPNIEFNILPGNSLIGLLHVDPAKFDAGNPRSQDSGEAGDQERITLEHPPEADGLGLTVESKTAPTQKEKIGAHLAVKRARKYDELLQEKNRLVDQYKRSALDFKDLSALKNNIEAKKKEAREILNNLLLGELVGLGIQFEQATWDVLRGKQGKPQKRRIQIGDIQTLQPFHWAYEFNEIVVARGGFDAIIAVRREDAVCLCMHAAAYQIDAAP